MKFQWFIVFEELTVMKKKEWHVFDVFISLERKVVDIWIEEYQSTIISTTSNKRSNKEFHCKAKKNDYLLENESSIVELLVLCEWVLFFFKSSRAMQTRTDKINHDEHSKYFVFVYFVDTL